MPPPKHKQSRATPSPGFQTLTWDSSEQIPANTARQDFIFGNRPEKMREESSEASSTGSTFMSITPEDKTGDLPPPAPVDKKRLRDIGKHKARAADKEADYYHDAGGRHDAAAPDASQILKGKKEVIEVAKAVANKKTLKQTMPKQTGAKKQTVAKKQTNAKTKRGGDQPDLAVKGQTKGDVPQQPPKKVAAAAKTKAKAGKKTVKKTSKGRDAKTKPKKTVKIEDPNDPFKRPTKAEKNAKAKTTVKQALKKGDTKHPTKAEVDQRMQVAQKGALRQPTKNPTVITGKGSERKSTQEETATEESETGKWKCCAIF